jgi:hypothetical protein
MEVDQSKSLRCNAGSTQREPRTILNGLESAGAGCANNRPPHLAVASWLEARLILASFPWRLSRTRRWNVPAIAAAGYC